MKANNKMTDEQLANIIEHCFDTADMAFSDVDMLEATTVAGKALQMMEEEAFQTLDFSVVPTPFTEFEPLAMCGFLGDDDEDEFPPDIDDDGDDNDDGDKDLEQ